MSKHPLLLGLTLLSASLFTDQAFADRTVTDQLGRQVTLPRPHHPRRGSATSDAQPAGATACRRGYRRRLKQLAETARAAVRPLYALRSGNWRPRAISPRSILKACWRCIRRVVFVANYAPPAMIAQIQQAGIPVVAISLRQDAAGEKK